MYMQKDTVIMHLICLKAARIACRICLLFCVCVQFSQHAIKKHSFKIKYNLDIVLVVDDFVWGYVGVEGSVVALECPEGHHHRDRRRVHCH